MKRSRACEDLVALETQKRNKTAVDDLTFAMRPSLLTRSASAEEELSLLLASNAFAVGLSTRLSFGDDDLDLDLDLDDGCLLRATRGLAQRADTRAVSLREKEARDAKHALQFKTSLKFAADDAAPLFQNSPDSTDHLFGFYAPSTMARRRSVESQVFDLTSFARVLETNVSPATIY